jgi:hypothetical protein
MRIVDSEIPLVVTVPPGTSANYNKDNPLWRLVETIEAADLACGYERYLADSLQYLFPFDELALYGPSGADWEVRDPRQQDNKNDFQKQNIKALTLSGMTLIRGYARAGEWTGAFLRVAYAPPPRSPLAVGGVVLDADLTLYLSVNGRADRLRVPYNEATHRYEIELWGRDGNGLRDALDERGRAALDRGELVPRPDLIRGSASDFEGPAFDAIRDSLKQQGRAIELLDHAPDHSLHPLRPLRLELAWADRAEQRWDSRGGRNYRLQFNMAMRGWRSYLAGGVSANPHGGVGTLEFRNLFSNYFGHEQKRRAIFGQDTIPELGRIVETFNFDAHGGKPASPTVEPFLAVDYMDLHMLRPECGIGIHRHRDNQEVFMLLSGKARMITGDWCEWPDRDRAFEVRTMQPGDLVLIKGGHLHALMNTLDENITLFMFGGYD